MPQRDPEEFQRELEGGLSNARVLELFGELVPHWEKLLANYLRCFMSNSADIQDIVQDTLVQFLVELRKERFEWRSLYQTDRYLMKKAYFNFQHWCRKHNREMPGDVEKALDMLACRNADASEESERLK